MPVAEICKEIRSRAEKDSRPSEDIFHDILQSGASMYFSRQWPRDAVIAFCASLVRFLDNQSPKQEKPCTN